jgi:hypothetical protein
MSGKKAESTNNPWRQVIADATRLLHRAFPGGSATHVGNKRQFLSDIEADKKKMNHFKKKYAMGEKRGESVIKDWYDTWVKNRTLAKASGDGTAGGAASAGDGWQTQGRQGRRAAEGQPASSTSTSTATSSSSANLMGRGGSSRGGDGLRKLGGDVNLQDDGGAAWKDLSPAADAPFVDPMGDEAPRLDVTDPVSQARGFHFCSSAEAARLRGKYAFSANPITFIIPFVDHITFNSIKDALKRETERSQGLVHPSITKASIFVKVQSTGARVQKDACLIHVDEAQPNLPPHLTSDGMLFTSPLPNVRLETRADEELQIAIVGPVCAELGLDEWWKKLVARPFPYFKEDIRKLLTSAKFKPGELRVRMSRRLMWRGEELNDARILTTLRVPKEHVDDLLARSGRHGIIVDRVRKDGDGMDQDFARVKLPSDWTAADANAKVDELPLHLKKATRGIVPTYRGYALRTTKDKEAEIVGTLLPETAAELGPALGLKTSSAWILRGVPKDASKEQLIRALYAPSMSWSGWTVRPRKTLGLPRFGKVNWVVDAAAEPPARSITFNDTDCIAIDRFIENSKTPPKAAPWYRDNKPEPEIVKVGGAWSDEEECDADGASFTLTKNDNGTKEADDFVTDDMQHDVQMDNMGDDERTAVPRPTPKAAAATPQNVPATGIARRMQAAGFRSNPYVPKAPPTATTTATVAPHSTPILDTGITEQAKSDRILDMLTAMQKENERKDALIQQLQDTIKMLNDQLTTMNAAMQQQQQQWQQQQHLSSIHAAPQAQLQLQQATEERTGQ